MLYLSQLLSAAAEDVQGARAGKIIDVLVDAPRRDAIDRVPTGFPTLVIEGEADQLYQVPVGAESGIPTWQGNVLRLTASMDAINRIPTNTTPSPQQISLAHEVLDKQVIDVAHKKAVRVNDICFGDDWRILGVDTSGLGLVRRLTPAWVLSASRKRAPAKLIPWEHIELVGESAPEDFVAPTTIAPTNDTQASTHAVPQPPASPAGARQQSGQLAELRPADIADILYQLTPGQGARLLEGLDDKTAADALEELDTERQDHILANIKAERAADILQEMEPDEAADLVARLAEEHAQQLLRLMNPEESEDVQELLEYEEDTAGGIMTTDFVVIDATKSAGEALEAVRYNIREQDVRLAYVYCVADEANEDYTLRGIVSLWDLLIADAAQPLQELMETDLVTVQPDAEPRAVAEVMAKYNFLAVPVVSEAGVLEGVITIDDALDILLPGERRKAHRMY